MSEVITGTKAAKDYAAATTADTPMPAHAEEFRIMLAIAFLEGAQWYNAQKLAQAQTELEHLSGVLKETHA